MGLLDKVLPDEVEPTIPKNPRDLLGFICAGYGIFTNELRIGTLIIDEEGNFALRKGMSQWNVVPETIVMFQDY